MKYTLELDLKEAQKLRMVLDSSRQLLWTKTILTGEQDTSVLEELKALRDKIDQAIEIQLFGKVL